MALSFVLLFKKKRDLLLDLTPLRPNAVERPSLVQSVDPAMHDFERRAPIYAVAIHQVVH